MAVRPYFYATLISSWTKRSVQMKISQLFPDLRLTSVYFLPGGSTWISKSRRHGPGQITTRNAAQQGTSFTTMSAVWSTEAAINVTHVHLPQHHAYTDSTASYAHLDTSPMLKGRTAVNPVRKILSRWSRDRGHAWSVRLVKGQQRPARRCVVLRSNWTLIFN